MCCRDLFPMSDMQSSLITTNSVSYEIPFLWFVTFRCIIPRGFMVDLLCILKVKFVGLVVANLELHY